MGLARNNYVIEGEEGVYHCISRCVRRAYLCGYDPLSGRDFSHRKKWILDRLKHLAGIFAIDVCAYAIMENHVHSILRTRPDILRSWSDSDVAARWLGLCPRKSCIGKKPLPPRAEQIQALTNCPEHIAVLYCGSVNLDTHCFMRSPESIPGNAHPKTYFVNTKENHHDYAKGTRPVHCTVI